MKELDINSYDELFQWSIQNRESFWDFMIKKLNIHFNISPSNILDHSSPGESLRWSTDAKFNIVDSCFQATEDSIAIIAQPEGGSIITIKLSNKKSNNQSIKSKSNKVLKSSTILKAATPYFLSKAGFKISCIGTIDILSSNIFYKFH